MNAVTPTQQFINSATLANVVAVITKTMRKYNTGQSSETVEAFYQTQGNYIVSKVADEIITRSQKQ